MKSQISCIQEIENFIFPLWPAQLMVMLVQMCPAQWGDLKLVQHLGGQPFFRELEVWFVNCSKHEFSLLCVLIH